LAEAALLLGAFAVFDYVTGYEINLSIFYLVPVIFLTWFVSRRAGIVMATLAIGLWAVVEFASGLRYSHSFYPVWNGAVRLTFFLIVVQLVHIMKDARAREAELARTDSLTGVANGRSFSDRAEFELAILRRTKHPLTMAYVDLDRFKHVNDTLGHTEGDRLLRAAAHAIQSRLRATDLVARLGGDEFGILLPDTDRHAAPAAIAAISEAVREVVDGSWDAGCTIGAMTFEMAPESVDFMVRSADELMYRGKRTGRGCVVHDVWPSKLMERPGSTTPPTC
jgi:diguanylate cyclase (GGDEF)-like protein